MHWSGVVVRTRCWWWWGCPFTQHEAQNGLGQKILKPTCWGSVSGVPCEIAMGDGGEMWCGGAYKMVVVGLCVRATWGTEQVRAKKPETEPLRLDFRRAAWNSNGGWCIRVAWWCVQGDGGGGVVCLCNVRHRVGMGQKTQNQAAMARFRAAVGLQEVERGAVGSQPPLLLLLSFSIHFLPLSTHS
jgi:hypothetical protein